MPFDSPGEFLLPDLKLRLAGIPRLLAPLQQQIVMNLLWVESAIPSSTMAAWVAQKLRPGFEDFIPSSPFISDQIDPESDLQNELAPVVSSSGTTGSFGVPAP
ncbi:hypothetical protein B0H13DRAFT_2522127 [Mycena leptocephala]|nr:hypothetical protein B0H13DRAFT_2522127 [Mycena leptocephala]